MIGRGSKVEDGGGRLQLTTQSLNNGRSEQWSFRVATSHQNVEHSNAIHTIEQPT